LSLISFLECLYCDRELRGLFRGFGELEIS